MNNDSSTPTQSSPVEEKLDTILEAVRELKDVEHNDNQWTTELKLNHQEAKTLLLRLINEARIQQIDEIIDIQEKQFNRWTQRDIEFFFQKVGRIYRELKAKDSSLPSGVEETDK